MQVAEGLEGRGRGAAWSLGGGLGCSRGQRIALTTMLLPPRREAGRGRTPP